ncbi:hypothetical protein HHL26_04720 [Sphingobium sp. TB-6]|uniref:helix-turn-helix domain-containing protein n=1 Tax=Sphingobium sp. TB-6 TaxID=2728850 RepID=UPI00146EC4FF|nr:helix-turn-helix domain-containing protein [Sphingobium sp. TB-6]NML88368.1 hypothetical protein [Sphingobium sp. TB-6]
MIALVQRVTIAALVERVAYETGLAKSDIRGRCRKHKLFRARAAVVWLAQRLTQMSSVHIGRLLERDHSTILHAAIKAEVMRETDPAFRRMTNRILTHFRDLQED